MVTKEMKNEAREFLTKEWGIDAAKVVAECEAIKNPFNNGSSKEFLTHCTACGGNWGGMLLSGIKRLWPKVYNAIPDDMGINAFACICYVMMLCGVNTAE